MTPRLRGRTVLSLLLLLIPGGCAGKRVQPGREAGWRPTIDGSYWPDLRGQKLDGGRPTEKGTALDSAVAHDTKSVTPDKPPPQQGKTCTAAGLTFTSDKPPIYGGGSLTLTVANGPAWVWVLGGVGAPTGGINWKGGPGVNDLGGGLYSWTFSGIPIPNAPGPYTFYFRKDAVNDNPALGSVVGSCTP